MCLINDRDKKKHVKCLNESDNKTNLTYRSIWEYLKEPFSRKLWLKRPEGFNNHSQSREDVTLIKLTTMKIICIQCSCRVHVLCFWIALALKKCCMMMSRNSTAEGFACSYVSQQFKRPVMLTHSERSIKFSKTRKAFCSPSYWMNQGEPTATHSSGLHYRLQEPLYALPD